MESGTIRGRSCRRQRCLGRGHELRIPAAEGVAQLVIEDACPDLEQEVGTLRCPAHLLLLDHPFAHHLVDRRLHERIGDRLASAVALTVARDPGGVGPDVAAELHHRLAELALRWTGLLDVEVHLQVLDHLESPEDVAHFSRSSSSATSTAVSPPRPLAICPMTVRRIVMWNQSMRCSAWGLRYSGSSRTSLPPSVRKVIC